MNTEISDSELKTYNACDDSTIESLIGMIREIDNRYYLKEHKFKSGLLWKYTVYEYSIYFRKDDDMFKVLQFPQQTVSLTPKTRAKKDHVHIYLFGILTTLVNNKIF